jgi:hypothetical protein
MANVLDALMNAASGGIVGSLLHLGSAWFDTYRKGKEADIQIRLMNAQSEIAEKSAAWAAFTASQQSQATPFSVPANAAPWAATTFTLVEALNRATRAGLCWIAVLLLASAYFAATPERQAAMQPEIQFGVWTIIFWFFGARYSKTAASK